jgi:hypothetical protein
MILARWHIVASPYSHVTIDDQQVITRFPDGKQAVCKIEQGDNPWYRSVAESCGYGEEWRFYAKHHDLFHSWLWENLHAAPSPTLWSVAHSQQRPECGDEEWLVNTIQWTVATGRRDCHTQRLARLMGTEWQAITDRLESVLHGIGLHPRSA